MAQMIDSKKIAKNTLLLYGRMILVLLVTLYTSRVVLKTLGVDDYGIYNVVGGVAVMFGFLQSAMSAATQRYLSFELGKGTVESVSKVFGTSLLIHYVIAIIIVVLSEAVGLWLISSEMTIPDDRVTAAHIVFQCSIAALFIRVVSVPYNAAIVAHESMNVYAYVGILDVLLKLGVAFTIAVGNMDRLILFAILNLAVEIILRVIYQVYCRGRFQESKTKAFYDKSLFKDMFSFAGWNIIGNMAFTLRNQGSNILLNIFFGPAVNAARGVAHQIDGAIEQFVTNLQTAANPQIVKSYAIQDYRGSIDLSQRIARYSFYLILCLGLPIILNIDKVLDIWLDKVPEYTAVFAIIILVNGLVDSISKPLKTLIKATGQIKWYMIIQGGWYMLALPVIWLFLKLGYGPVSSMIVLLAFTAIGTFIRLFLVRNFTQQFSIRYYCKDVMLPVSIVSFAAVALSLFAVHWINPMSLSGFFLRVGASLLITLVIVFLLGFRKEERKRLFSLIHNLNAKRKH